MPVIPDSRLLSGFRFRCLPGCGLCCYTTPAVAPSERAPLVQLDPAVPLIDTPEGWAQIGSRPEGGACYFLRQERCSCHAVRPATCAEFPLTVHAGRRVQLSVVLSCPGVDLSPLSQTGIESLPSAVPPELRSEFEAVTLEVGRAESSGQLRWASQRWHGMVRRLRRAGIWQSEEVVRDALRGHLNDFILGELSPYDVPDEDDDLEALPMFYDSAKGRVAWRSHPGGVEFLSLQESGGIESHMEVLPLPTRSPGLDPSSRSLLQGYLAYLLERDATLSAAYARLDETQRELPADLVAEDLRSAASQVIRMAVLRRALTSDQRGALAPADVENGIRATDMDLLDRPMAGLRL
jgi:hypothetical protein